MRTRKFGERALLGSLGAQAHCPFVGVAGCVAGCVAGWVAGCVYSRVLFDPNLPFSAGSPAWRSSWSGVFWRTDALSRSRALCLSVRRSVGLSVCLSVCRSIQLHFPKGHDVAMEVGVVLAALRGSEPGLFEVATFGVESRVALVDFGTVASPKLGNLLEDLHITEGLHICRHGKMGLAYLPTLGWCFQGVNNWGASSSSPSSNPMCRVEESVHLSNQSLPQPEQHVCPDDQVLMVGAWSTVKYQVKLLLGHEKV